MAFFLDKQILAANGAPARKQYGEITARRRFANNNEAHLASMQGLDVNVGRIPQDVYRDFDAQTKSLMTGDEGGVLLDDLLPLARSVDIGKITSEYRRVSDGTIARSSISGQHAKPVDHVSYDYDGTLVLIHDSAFGREWREMEAMRSEGFSPIVDDQAAATRAVRRKVIDNFINGDSNAVFKGISSFGIKNSPGTVPLNLGAGGLNVDLTSAATTYAQRASVFIAAITLLQGRANNVEGDIMFYVSPEIWFNQLTTGTNDTRFQTFLEGLQRIPGVAGIKKTNVLTGNQFFAIRMDRQYIQPVVGMAMTTTPMMRTTPFSDYHWLTWMAAGIQVKRDFAGRSGVLYAS